MVKKLKEIALPCVVSCLLKMRKKSAKLFFLKLFLGDFLLKFGFPVVLLKFLVLCKFLCEYIHVQNWRKKNTLSEQLRHYCTLHCVDFLHSS